MKSKIFKLAHKMAKETKAKYPDCDYRATFGACLKIAYKEISNKPQYDDKGFIRVQHGEFKITHKKNTKTFITHTINNSNIQKTEVLSLEAMLSKVNGISKDSFILESTP